MRPACQGVGTEQEFSYRIHMYVHVKNTELRLQFSSLHHPNAIFLGWVLHPDCVK